MEFNINFKIDPLVIKIDVNPQFTQTLAMLAAAFGYPAKTIASEMKQTAQEMKAKAEAPKAVEQPKEVKTVEQPKQENVEPWTVESLSSVLTKYLNKGVTNNDIKAHLKKIKDKNNNPMQGIRQLVQEKSKEEIDKFLSGLRELFKEDSNAG